MGEPAGIGGEIALMAWRRHEQLPTFVLLDDPERLSVLAANLGFQVPVETVDTPEEAAAIFHRALPVLRVPLPCKVEPGRPQMAAAGAVIESIDRAVALTRAGRTSAVVTSPIHKSTLYQAGFGHPGHTEYLAALADMKEPAVMMLACATLRVVPVTVHLSLRDAVGALTEDAIVHAGLLAARALEQDFAVARPRLAVAALNPHAGEDGELGREEIDIIAPAVARLREAGIPVTGPAPADTLFHAHARPDFDAVLCMYHDQALIPLKTVDFDGGVNVTLGLPFVRTSPDHGTAFDIAGSGRASAASLMAAMDLASAIARNRVAASGRRVA
jgi:4-hydroxythreonine-4-phosphate dehydrogenase